VCSYTHVTGCRWCYIQARDKFTVLVVVRPPQKTFKAIREIVLKEAGVSRFTNYFLSKLSKVKIPMSKVYNE